ncbi:DUF6090 family protein [Aegicerativicinus sediminis]|uniref:DUF6090 family protein n=1 Tax=Aegicerativicinus sediminis TaxID=2893202 RepID=UPI001E5CBC46|nr:DUF6090 family protein [Aegicerativicinus sediminis]
MENKTEVYIKYAIGEIILVVIGILIALQINNWNEERKDNIAENNALVALKNEFDWNIKRLQNICQGRNSAYSDRLKYWNLITNDSIPFETKFEAYPKGFFGGSWAAQNTVLNGLVNSGQIDNIKNDTLKKLLISWPNQVKFWDDDEDKWQDANTNLSNYLITRLRRVPAFTSEGNLWQSNYENYNDEIKSQTLSFINDLEYQNLLSKNINQLYILTIHCDRLMATYQKIISNLNREIKLRNIK